MQQRDYFAGDPRTNRERMLAGDLYIADDPDSERIARQAAVLVDRYQRAVVDAQDAQAREILTELLGSLGDGAFIKPPLAVDYGENIHVERREPGVHEGPGSRRSTSRPSPSARTARSARTCSC